MKNLKLLEELFKFQIRLFENNPNMHEEKFQDGLLFGLRMALNEVKREIKKLQEK